jgi:hypothetical protein
VDIIYEQVLRLTPRGRAGLTSGEVASLVAVDTQKVRVAWCFSLGGSHSGVHKAQL